MEKTDDDVADLVALFSELNMHSDLGAKLSSTRKIIEIFTQPEEGHIQSDKDTMF
jgi:hypothetical protein